MSFDGVYQPTVVVQASGVVACIEDAVIFGDACLVSWRVELFDESERKRLCHDSGVQISHNPRDGSGVNTALVAQITSRRDNGVILDIVANQKRRVRFEKARDDP